MCKTSPGSSAGKESTCNAGGSWFSSWVRKILWKRVDYLWYSWASLVAQLVKNPPAMWETWLQSLGWEDPLEKRKATHSSILAWRIPWTVHGVAKSWTWLSNFHFHFSLSTCVPLLLLPGSIVNALHILTHFRLTATAMLLQCPFSQGIVTEGPKLAGTLHAKEMQWGTKQTESLASWCFHSDAIPGNTWNK